MDLSDASESNTWTGLIFWASCSSVVSCPERDISRGRDPGISLIHFGGEECVDVDGG